MSRIEKLLKYLKETDKDSFLQHALALEYIKIGEDSEARKLFIEILLREPDYIGSYYHLGKLLERGSEFEAAKSIYVKGIDAAQKIGDNHSRNELQAALEDLDDG